MKINKLQSSVSPMNSISKLILHSETYCSNDWYILNDFYIVRFRVRLQGRNGVCGIRDQRGGIKDRRDGIWDHSPGLRDHRPWDRNQQFFRDQGSGCTIIVGSGTKMGHPFGIKDQKSAYKNGISKQNIPRYHPAIGFENWTQLNSHTIFLIWLRSISEPFEPSRSISSIGFNWVRFPNRSIGHVGLGKLVVSENISAEKVQAFSNH